jgi:D-alanyl-D-alanine carboxypeptidase
LAANINGSDIQLKLGEKITVHELLRGLMIQSGNDAAFALADHYSPGDNEYKAFVAKMNEYVAVVGLKNTVFGDPAGLDDETGRSTAADLAHIARLVLQDPVLGDIIATAKTTIQSVDGAVTHELTNSNRLLLGDSPYYLPGAIGVKTGFTPEAGHCLVSAYQSAHGLLIGVVLNTAEYTITASASESRKLYTWADRYVEARQY